MRILWICNIALPEACELLGLRKTPFGGWLAGLSQALSTNTEIELSIAFPVKTKKVQKTNGMHITYYAFPQINKKQALSKKPNSDIKSIIDDVKPDILHIHGTEYPHTLAAVKCFDSGKTVISIQGLLSIIARHYFASLPSSVLNKVWIGDIIFRRWSIRSQAKTFHKNGLLEIEAIQKVRHVIGRTDWDRACAMQINPQAEYHLCNETLRSGFYLHKWDLDKCDKYSIFISQASYPIKGLHFMLEAMPEIIRRFPQTHLYIAGENITSSGMLKDRLKRSSYGRCVMLLIKKYKLTQHITFTGNLDEKQMCERLLKTNVFVSASTIENESNSLSEAKMLGVPSVASFAGGVTSRIEHNIDSFAYQHDAPYMLAYYVCEIFSNDKLALRFSENARQKAEKRNDRDDNQKQILQIYRDILKYCT